MRKNVSTLFFNVRKKIFHPQIKFAAGHHRFCRGILADTPELKGASFAPDSNASVFPSFKLIIRSFSSNQSATLATSFVIFDLIDSIFLSSTYKTTSSAYFTILDCSITSTMSLNDIKNSKGPNSDP